MIEGSLHYGTYFTKMILDALEEELPEEAIFKIYQQAKEKDWFVVAILSVLMLRHRQWQAGGKEGSV